MSVRPTKMYLQRLTLVNLRNYDKTRLEFSPKINVIYGLNAQGKTNLLEAIYLLCLGRSFRLARNQDILKYGEDAFTVEGLMVLDSGIQKSVVVRYVLDNKKEISVDRKRLRGHAEIFGQFPVVVMAPDEFKITTGGPTERRRFLDILLSQLSLSYLKTLQEYNRILKQRNKILQHAKEGVPVSDTALEPWSESLVLSGSKILFQRARFIKEFSELLGSIYGRYTEGKDALEVELESSINFTSVDQGACESGFRQGLAEVRAKEAAVGTTLVGPHRDDLVFRINGRDLRRFGSRGEHKTVLLSIKVAEFEFLKEKKQETPVLLLDDCYSELDTVRERQVAFSLEEVGQTFLTTPRVERLFERNSQLSFSDEVSTFQVENGRIVEQG